MKARAVRQLQIVNETSIQAMLVDPARGAEVGALLAQLQHADQSFAAVLAAGANAARNEQITKVRQCIAQACKAMKALRAKNGMPVLMDE